MTDAIETHLSQAKTHLIEARRALAAEISSYPTPISGCDAQFNHLLAERGRIAAALSALETLPFVPTPRMPVPATCLESR